MPANAMGRRATVVIPQSTKKKNDAGSTEAGTDFKSIMKETSEPAKIKRADQATRSERADDKRAAQAARSERADAKRTEDTEPPEEEWSQDQVAAAEQAGASTSEDVAPSDAAAAAESAGEGGSESEEQAVFSELFTESVLSEETFGVTVVTPEVAQDALSVAPIAKDQLPDLPETPELLSEVVVEVAPTLEPSSVDGAALAAASFASTESTASEVLVAGQREAKGAFQKVVAPASAESKGRGPGSAAVNPALLGEESGLLTEEGQLVESEALESVSEGLDKRLAEAGRPSVAPQVRATAAPGLAMTAQANMEAAPQQSSRIPTGLESVDLGAAEQDPLEGSVKLNGVRGARIAVPMDDGTMLRGRLDLVDDALDVAIRASEDMGLRADQRVGELREALAEHGIDLGEFDVSADANQNEEAGEGEDGTGSEASDRPSADRDSGPVRDLQEELEELRNENGFGYYDEGNPGALINRRL